MAHFELRISGDTNDDAHIFGLFAGAGAGPAPVDAAGLTAADKPERVTRKGNKGAAGSTTDATAASPATEPVTPVEQLTPEQQKAVDPAVAAAQGGDAYEGKVQPNTGQKAAEPAPVVEDEVGETASPVASAEGDVTLEQLKAVMTRALDKNSAKVCQDAVRAAADGAASLSSAAAQHYPAIYAALLPLAGE